MKRKWIGVLVLILMLSLSVSALAATEDSRILDEIKLEIREECSDHPSFIHYLVREDGLLAVYSRTSDNSSPGNGVFDLAYIDLFDSEGSFLREIVLQSRDDLVLSFTEDTLDIYLSEWALSVDLITWEVVPNKTDRYVAQNSELRSVFHQKKQTAAGWRYTCEGTSMNHTGIVRENEESKEILLSLSGNVPGTGRPAASIIPGAILCGCLIAGFVFLWKRKRN